MKTHIIQKQQVSTKERNKGQQILSFQTMGQEDDSS